MPQTQVKGLNVGDKSLTAVDIDFSVTPLKNPPTVADTVLIVDSADGSLKKVNQSQLISNLGNRQAVGAYNIVGSGVETDIIGMSLTFAPQGSAILIMFSAPIHPSATHQWVTFYMNVDGVNVRKHTIQVYTDTVTLAFQHIQPVTQGVVTTVKMRWNGSTSIGQRGYDDSERVFSIIDLP